MDVSFIRVMRKASYMDLKDRGELVPGGIYFVTVNTSPLIFSIIRANTETEDEVVMKNSIATKPILDNDGLSLLYYDAGGNQQKIVLSGITIGDKRSTNPLPLSIDGVPIEGQLMDSDTISHAMAKLYNAIGSGGSAELVKAMIRLKGYVGTQEDLYMKKSCVTGSAFINTSPSPVTYSLRDKIGSFKTLNVWPGDMLVVVNDNISGITDQELSAATVGWMVLHTGDSLDQFIESFLSKVDADTAAGLITFLQGIVSKSVEIGDYQEGMTTGSGAMIDEGGNAEMQSLILRSFLKVPSLIYNKIEVTGGEMWNTTGGVIKSVVPDGLHSFVLTLDIEDGDHVEFHIDDICKGIYNVGTGFVTSYFRVVHVDDAAKTIRVVLGSDSAVPGGMNSNPVKFMNIAKYGNFTNKERKRSQYFSSSEQKIIMLSDVDDYIIRPENIVLQMGSLTGVNLPDNLPIDSEDASIYLKNVIAENFFQIDSKGEVIKQIIDRGLWVVDASPAYVSNRQFQDEVYHKSCKYRCIVDGTNQEPRYDSTDWLLVAGDTSLGMFVSSSAGQSFKYNELYTTLTATVYRGVTDITGDVMAEDWSWTRETSDVVGDAAWNSSHANATNTVSLTPSDLNNTTGKFTCTAYVRDGLSTEILTQEILF